MLARIDSVKTDLATDEDFAEAQDQVKSFKIAEKALDEAKVSAQEQSIDIHHLFQAIDQVKARIRETRLTLNRQVTSRKTEIKNTLVNHAIQEVREYIEHKDVDFNVINSGDFTQRHEYTEAIKGKSSLTAAKRALEMLCDRQRSEINSRLLKAAINAKALEGIQEHYAFLFPDKKPLLRMNEVELSEVIKNRIEEYQRKPQEPSPHSPSSSGETPNEGRENHPQPAQEAEPTTTQPDRLTLLNILEPLAKEIHPVDGSALTEQDYEPIGELLSAVSQILKNLSTTEKITGKGTTGESTTTKTILVLANSSKTSGRCVAGIEILSDTPEGIRFGDFIRPIDLDQPEGSLRVDTATIDGYMVRPLDIVEMKLSRHADDPNHLEDWIIYRGCQWQLRGQLSPERLEEVPHGTEDIWGKRKGIEPGTAKATIQVIKTEQPLMAKAHWTESSGYSKVDKRLAFNGLNVSITDTRYIDTHNMDNLPRGKEGLVEIPTGSFIVLSLTPPFEPHDCGTKYQYRVAAAIIENRA